jgi:YHS domain-containing protein
VRIIAPLASADSAIPLRLGLVFKVHSLLTPIREKGPSMTSCPVCGMKVDKKNAAAQTTYEGKTYYFCSKECQDTFTANPEKYTEKAGAPLVQK